MKLVFYMNTKWSKFIYWFDEILIQNGKKRFKLLYALNGNKYLLLFICNLPSCVLQTFSFSYFYFTCTTIDHKFLDFTIILLNIWFWMFRSILFFIKLIYIILPIKYIFYTHYQKKHRILRKKLPTERRSFYQNIKF